jgi:GTPase SAR1 family protein
MPEKITLFDSVHRGDYWDYFIKTMLPGKDIYFICFSVVNLASYENVQKNWVPQAREHPNTELMLIGTKADLADDLDTRNRLKGKHGKDFEPISYNQGLQLAKEIGAMGYFETSAITGVGIKGAFTFAVEEYSRRRKMNHQKTQNKQSQRCVLQ